MAKTSGLTVRQYVRQEVDVPVEFTVDLDYRNQVHFSSSSGAIDTHTFEAKSVDLSPGGAGVSSKKFIPRGCAGQLKIFAHKPNSTVKGEVIFEHAVKVRRVYLTGHEPTYFLGMSFIDPADDFNDRFQGVLEQIGHDESEQSADEVMAGEDA